MAFGRGAINLSGTLDLETFAIVEHAFVAGDYVLPDRAELRLVFRHGSVRAAEASAPTRLCGSRGAVAASAIACGPRRVEEGSGIDSHEPAMAIGGHVGVDEEVIADGKLIGQSVEVGRHFQMCGRFLLRSPAIHAIAS